ncbi:uncharacterized protein LOC132088282 [Daphnia carinata]|uniref:uncharacterized protein LOC132088282 n=1 Tax=Daphnia carinata TaxID=120202 RepID=UPI0028688917|nr:uncharacterized protein LOC132088282 [Daphnia carinata]
MKSVSTTEDILVTTQLKIMDVAPPLISLFARLSALGEGEVDTQVRDAVEAALQQWGRAYLHVTRLRRQAVVTAVEPKGEFMLSDSDIFSVGKEARELLFTDKFLTAMLKEAKQDATLAQRDGLVAAARQPTTQRSTPRARRVAMERPAFVSSRTQRPALGAARGRGRGRMAQNGRGRAGLRNTWALGQRYIIPFSSVPHHFHVGGRLKFFAKNWKRITNDVWVLQTVSRGFEIDLVSEPIQGGLPPPVSMSERMAMVCDKEVRDLIRKRAIVEVVDNSEGCVHSFFAAPKKSKGLFRPIVNLKPLNTCIQYEHFKMENLEAVRFLLREGDWMVKLDLEDAYLTVPVHPDFHKFLRFLWRGRVFQFSCLAFGLAPAPRVFTKLLKVVMAVLRREGIRLVVYLDDILIMNASKEGLRTDIERVVGLIQSLGFLLNWSKSVLKPTQILEYLALMVNSKRMSFALPAKKVLSVKAMCQAALDKNRISLREIASILGNFTWAIPSIPFAQSHYRSMQRFYIEQAKEFAFNLNASCILSEGARVDLKWWVCNLDASKDRLFFPKVPDLEICADASLSGWGGACCNGVRTGGPWTLSDTSKHINELELIGAFYAIQSFTAASRDIAIRIFLDNTTAVAYINNCGGTKSIALSVTSKLLTDWCEERGVAVEAVHLAGKLNGEADEESRSADASDWRLCPTVFSCINNVWPTDVDLFAAPWNAQLASFVSWRPQPEAMATNAFALNWGGLSGYVFPPFCLIFKCLEKIRREQATVVFICPVWTGQPWFPLLLELACEVPRLLHPSPTLLTSALEETHPLLTTGALHLAAWKLSGVALKGEAFRRSWSSYSWRDAVSMQTQPMSRRGEIGWIGAWGGIRIPCQTA